MNAPDSYRDFVRDLLGICSRCPHSSQGQALHQLVREIETFACKARDKLDRASVDQRTSAATPASPAQVGAQPAGRVEAALHENIMNEIPRRARLDQMIGAERAIYDAVQTVEEMAADPLLTEAVILLQQARSKVADFVDRATPPTAGAADDGENGR